MQMLKRALIAYVNSIKAVWSAVAYPLSIPSKREGNVKDYRIYGNSIQDGTPTPEKPIEVQSVGELVTEGEYTGKYKVPVMVRGKNILESYTVAKGYWLDSSGGASASSTRLLRVSQIKVEPNTQYTISSNVALYTVWYARSTKDSDTITRINLYGLFKKTFTTPEECNYIRVSLDLQTTNQTGEGVSAVKWVMLEKGKGDGVYEPYIEPQIHNIYLDEPLKMGEVIQQSINNLPVLPQYKGTTIYEVQTAVPPSGIEVCYIT